MVRNLVFSLVGLLFLITPSAYFAAPDVFAASVEARRHNAFTHVTGMTEAIFKGNLGANTTRVVHHNAAGEYWITNVNTHREWFAGKFETASIQELRDAVDAKEADDEADNAGTFNVITGFHPTNLSLAQQRRCNITALQANSAHIGAVFQVASNFNCLEGAGPDLTTYTHARAQGELAAISALPGTIVRRYCLGQINLLSNLRHPLFRLTGIGASQHLDFNETAPRALQQAANFDYTRVQVGIHLDTDVTFGLVRAGARGAVGNHTTCRHSRTHPETNPNIIQIYTSAVNLNLNAQANFTPVAYTHIETIAKKMLKASYEGTLLAAALHGEQPELYDKQQEVFLTLMGCGAFHNKLEWVAEVLEELIGDMQALNLKVTLLIFDGSINGMPAFLRRMQVLVRQSGGYYQEIRP